MTHMSSTTIHSDAPFPPRVFTRQQLRELDRRAAEEFGIPLLLLMENAGRAVAETAWNLIGSQRGTILILVGPGNNGADGLVAARHLAEAGSDVGVAGGDVEIFTLFDPSDPKILSNPALATHLNITRALQLPLTPLVTSLEPLQNRLPTNRSTPSTTPTTPPPPLLIIDALFGTGLTRPLSGIHAAVVELINASGHPVLAIDIPSGLDADTGLPVGNGPAIKATHTISFCGWKTGFLNPAAQTYTGQIRIAHIGVPRVLLNQLSEPLPPLSNLE